MMAVTKNASLKKDIKRDDALRILVNKYVAFEATKGALISKGWIKEEQCEKLFNSQPIIKELEEELKKYCKVLNTETSVSDKVENIDSVLNAIMNE